MRQTTGGSFATPNRGSGSVSLALSWVALLGLLAGTEARAADAGSGLEFYEKILRDARITPDGPALLRYFRERTLSERDRARLANMVRLLGHAEYRVRRKAFADLIAAGRPALVFINQALKDPDLEIARRAEELKRRIEVGDDSLTVAAAHVVAAHKPPGTVAVLLAYFPMADDPLVRETLFEALATAGIQDGKVDPVLTAALTDKAAPRRGAAAYVLGRMGGQAQREGVRKCLG